MRVAIHTFGCKVNQYDSEALARLLRERGHTVSGTEEPADVIIVNTCAVTGESERKARQFLRRMAKENPEAVLVATGCYGQTAPEEIAKLDCVKLITGVKDRERLADLIDRLPAVPEPVIQVEDWSEGEEFRWNAAEFPTRSRAFLKIEDGCSSSCSYCKVPMARGPVRSLPADLVEAEFRRLLRLGHREIVLAGVHLGCYGKDLGTGLDEVVLRLDCLPGVYRFRLSSIEPTDFSPALLAALEKAEHLCPHLHIPVQSGSRTVLQRMNRGYTPDEFHRLLERLRAIRPDLAVTTDVIVGFPGETDAEFRETRDFLEKERFSGLHVFPFSAREGTAAFGLPGRIPRRIKQERVKILLELGKRLTADFARGMLGREAEVLIEENGPDGGEGFSEHYLRTVVKGWHKIGSLLKVRLTGLEKETLYAVPLNEE